MTANGNYPPGMTRQDWQHVNGEDLGDSDGSEEGELTNQAGNETTKGDRR